MSGVGGHGRGGEGRRVGRVGKARSSSETIMFLCWMVIEIFTFSQFFLGHVVLMYNFENLLHNERMGGVNQTVSLS